MIFLLLVFNSCKKKVNKEENLHQEALKSFTYVPPSPSNGNLYGVVELGAAGFNSFIINADEKLNWKLEQAEFGKSLLVEGMTNTLLINEKLREYIDELKKSGLLEENIYFVVSSGAIKEDITKLIIGELKKIGYEVNSVTPHEEGAYALKAILPNEFKNNSLVVDMGSGNTKVAFTTTNNEIKTIESIGAKYYQKGIEDKEVYEQIRNAISKVPAEKRDKIFIIGGVPSQMAKSISSNKNMYTVLSPNISSYSKIEGKKAKSGLNIFKAIVDETKAKQIIFFNDGNFAIGFLLDKIR